MNALDIITTSIERDIKEKEHEIHLLNAQIRTLNDVLNMVEKLKIK